MFSLCSELGTRLISVHALM